MHSVIINAFTLLGVYNRMKHQNVHSTINERVGAVSANYSLSYMPPHGGAAKKPILFIHGLWNDGAIWATWARDFASRGYPSWSITIHAGSSNLSIRDYADVVNDALLHIGLEHGVVPVLVGHSLGGLVAQVVASEREVPALVLIESVVPAGIGNSNWSWIGHLFRYIPRLFSHLWTRGFNRNVEEYLIFREMLMRFRTTLAASFGAKWGEMELDPLNIGGLQQPDPPRVSRAVAAITFGTVKIGDVQCQDVLIVAGRQDKIISLRAQQALAKKYAQRSTMIVHQFGHMVMHESGASTVAGQILHWLEHLK